MPSDGKYQTPLLSAIANLYESGAYSDLKIICGSETYNVHKNIICPQSDFFHAACRPDTFQEGQTGVITIPANAGCDRNLTPDTFDWDQDVETVETVKAMIHYFYHRDYLLERVSDHARMYAMGEKYGVETLKSLAQQKFGQSFRDKGTRTSIIIAFMSTPKNILGLRTTVISNLGDPANMQQAFDLDSTIKAIPDLIYPLYRRLFWRNYRLLER